MVDELIVGAKGFQVVAEGAFIEDPNGKLAIVRALADGAIVTVESLNGVGLISQGLDPLGGTLHGSFTKITANTGDLIVYSRY